MKLGMLDVSIIVIYLIMCLIIGFYRSTKLKTLKQFALGYQSLSTTMLVCVIFASTIGGGTILSAPEQLYVYGVAFLIGRMFMPLSWFITAKIYGPNIEQFKGCLSISQIMYKLYGSPGRWITNISTFINGLGTVAAQALAVGYIFYYFFGIEVIYGMLVSFSVLTLYTALGGIRAVILTEVFQFCIFFFIIPVSYLIAMMDVNGISSLMQKLPASTWNFEWTIENVILIASFMFYAIIPTSESTLLQRYLMASSAAQLQKSLMTIVLISIPFSLSICLIAYIVQTHVYNDVPAKEAFLFYINHYLPVGFKGLLLAGIIAAIMNVAEAWLNATSVILVNDVVKILFPEISHKWQIAALRTCVIILAVTSVVIASFSKDIKGLILFVDNFGTPLILIPLISGFLGFRTSGKSFIASAMTAVIFTVVGRVIIGKFSATSLILGLLGSAVGLFFTHYWQVADNTLIISKRSLLSGWLWRQVLKTKNSGIVIVNSVLKFIKQLRDSLAQKKQPYQQFATFTLIYYFAYTFNLTADPAHRLLTYLLVIGYFFCFVLLLRDIIFSRNFQKKYLSLYWHFTLTFCLPSIASYMLFTSEGDDFWIINGLLTAFSLCLFVDAITFIILFSIGIAYGYGLFLINGSGNEMLQAHNTIGNIGYIYLFFLFIFLIFFRGREKEQEERVKTMHLFGGAIAHEVRTPMSGLITAAHGLDALLRQIISTAKRKKDKYLLKIDEGEYIYLNQLNDSIRRVGAQGMTTIDSILTALKSSVVGDDKQIYLIKECIEQATNEFMMLNEHVNSVKVSIKNNFKVKCSLSYIKHVFFNLFKNAYKYGGTNVRIKIWTEDYNLHFKDYGKGIAKEDLPYIFDRFYTKSRTGTGIGLAFCKMVIEDLGGDIECKSELGKYTEFILTFPKSHK